MKGVAGHGRTVLFVSHNMDAVRRLCSRGILLRNASVAFNGDTGAAAMGLAWVAGRIWYALAYQKDPAKRGGGFSLALLAIAGLWAGGLWGVVKALPAAF